uniref:non-specific serine/threonine protein kinase n=1 Tax=Helicoverpa armigera TaxID=29058 RepID=A0A385LUT7_HELAM|nr:death-associated protein kinase 1 [Helicoverpa armigera]
MSVLSGLSKADFKTASDGLLELPEERLRSLMRTEPITSVYHVEQTPFARGKFASVRKIRHLVSGEEYAAKIIRKRRRAADTTREILHEVAVLDLCAECTRVVSLHEVYETRSEVAIVLELCAGGELQRLLDEEDRLTEGAARRALRHVLEGLAHLHARRVAHLDLKPQNLLLTAGGEELLICDFGISRAIQPGAHVREILGTRDYVAPEILSYEPLSLAADIWSVGVLAYVLLSGYSPFAGETKQETYLNIAQCQLSFPKDLFRGVSQRAIQFIKGDACC